MKSQLKITDLYYLFPLIYSHTPLLRAELLYSETSLFQWTGEARMIMPILYFNKASAATSVATRTLYADELQCSIQIKYIFIHIYFYITLYKKGNHILSDISSSWRVTPSSSSWVYHKGGLCRGCHHWRTMREGGKTRVWYILVCKVSHNYFVKWYSWFSVVLNGQLSMLSLPSHSQC